MGCASSAPASNAPRRTVVSARFVREWRLPSTYDADAQGTDGASPRTIAEVDRAREAFWDTCATYGGDEQVWGALRAACESGAQDAEEAASARAALAMVLSSCAEDLSECYDERGVKYALPAYVRAYPSCALGPAGVAD
jgi:hypothetical protein